MKWYDDYKDRLKPVYDEAERIIGKFPAPLNKVGLAYADKFHPVKDNGGKDYICTLLPYWMKDAAGINDEDCDQFALINVFLMLYFFIQDDVMDEGPASDVKEKLALGNLLFMEMLRMLQRIFPSHSPFWGYFNRYVTEWADCVVNESNHDPFMTNPVSIAYKASPIKLASTGTLLLGGKFESISKVEKAVDIALMSLQLADDWVDWKKDLQEGSYNSLLAMIAAEQPSDAPITEDIVQTFVYVRCCLSAYADIARKHHDRLLDLHTNIDHLINFNSYIVDRLTQTAKSIESNRDLMKKGGLNYYFAKQVLK